MERNLHINFISPLERNQLSKYFHHFSDFTIGFYSDSIFLKNKKIISSDKFRKRHYNLASGVNSSHVINCYWTSIGHSIDHYSLNLLPKLDYIVTATTGLTHIDTREACRRGVEIISLAGEKKFLKTITATPEHTWGLILGLWRKSFLANALPSFQPLMREAFMSTQLAGKTIGIIGMGRVGRQLYKYARAFNMNVIAYDKYVNGDKFLNSGSAKTKMGGVKFVESILDIAKHSDVIVVCASVLDMDKENYPLVSKEFISVTKKGSILVNTARGVLVDEIHLLKALERGHLGGLGFDVLSCEDANKTEKSISAASKIFQAKAKGYNIVVTPHIAGMCSDSLEAAMGHVAKMLKFRISKKLFYKIL